jgi:hypothetical protein
MKKLIPLFIVSVFMVSASAVVNAEDFSSPSTFNSSTSVATPAGSADVSVPSPVVSTPTPVSAAPSSSVNSPVMTTPSDHMSSSPSMTPASQLDKQCVAPKVARSDVSVTKDVHAVGSVDSSSAVAPNC